MSLFLDVGFAFHVLVVRAPNAFPCMRLENSLLPTCINKRIIRSFGGFLPERPTTSGYLAANSLLISLHPGIS